MYEFPFIVMLSLVFTRLNHPLSTGLVLLAQTVLISVSVGLFGKRYWFSYILFLIFLGGMLVLFIYVASLAANEQFKVRGSVGVAFLIRLIRRVILIMFDPCMLVGKVNFPFSGALPVYSDIRWGALRVNVIYNLPRACFTLAIISYLLLALYVVARLIRLSSGPLRFRTYDNTFA